MANNRYCIDLAKRGTAGCKNCNQKVEKGVVRIGKIIPNPFTDSGGEMKQWFHVKCIFDKLSRARATTKKIESTDDLEGWEDLSDEHKDEVLKHLSEVSTTVTMPKAASKKKTTTKSNDNEAEEGPKTTVDNSLKQFRKICYKITKFNKHTDKTGVLENFFKCGSDGESFKGDLYLWLKLLLPAVEKRVYNLQNTELIKHFSKIFEVSREEMLENFEQSGDVSETIETFYTQSNTFDPADESSLYLHEVDKYLDDLTKTGAEVHQIKVLTEVAKRCTSSDLKYFVRFIKHDLRINAGAKLILTAVHPTAYEAFQASRDLKAIVSRVLNLGTKGAAKVGLAAKSSLMTPVLPMLAKACTSIEMPFKMYPEGFYVEIKYDGERVQIHKEGNNFSYFSRSLKPVMPHKISHFKDYIPRAFPHGNNLILDCEILLVDTEGKPLPFGTLGAHRKTAFKDATVCLFVFDCLQFNEENIMNKCLEERRNILLENMSEIEKHVMFSQLKEIKSMKKMQAIVNSVIDQGLEGLVIKSKNGVYEPGKRHWLKLKKDYLMKGKMADSADLVVIGGYYGTGRKGGIMSVFLMGCYDESTKKWCTVTKVPGGDDDTLAALQKSLKMRKISKDPTLVPPWLNINKSLVPDFVVLDFKESPVWEVSGAEFSKAEAHTAAGISIRFPRVARVRDDKDWQTATTLKELKYLFKESKKKSELIGLKTGNQSSDEDDDKESVIRPGSSNSRNLSSTENTPVKRPKGSDVTPKKIKKDFGNSSLTKPLKKEPESPSEFFRHKKKRDSDESLTPSKKPKKEVEESSKSTSSGSNVLANIFSGVKMHIPSSLEKSEILLRYFVAYDGVLLKDHEISEATHVIGGLSNKSSFSIPKGAKKISSDWLWDCIKLKKTLPTKPYKPCM